MQATETALDIEAYRTLLKNAGIDADRLAVDDKGTLAVDISRVPDAARDLPTLATELVVRAPIAKGGMGEIHLARQISLGRDVAVKRASPRAPDRAHATEALVHEARITGALEHPNIVPIHALGRSNEGDALLVMKRIDGEGGPICCDDVRLRRTSSTNTSASSSMFVMRCTSRTRVAWCIAT